MSPEVFRLAEMLFARFPRSLWFAAGEVDIGLRGLMFGLCVGHVAGRVKHDQQQALVKPVGFFTLWNNLSWSVSMYRDELQWYPRLRHPHPTPPIRELDKAERDV